MTQRFQLLSLFFAIASLSLPAPLSADSPKSFELPLWEKGAPGSIGNEAKDIPLAKVRLPSSDKPTGALIICPGGGYGNLAMGHEGQEIAEWANEMGLAAIICDYRHRGKGYGHPAPLQDAQRAIRLVRTNAKQWNVDPARVGIMGFSAGGHLVSTVLTRFDFGDPNNADPIEHASSRPDYGILAYPVILFGQPGTHKGSEKNLLGESPDPKLVESFQSDLNVTKDTPPTFLFHTLEDKGVVPQNSVAFFAAMLRNGVSGELHVFEKGSHGKGLAKTIQGTSEWPNVCRRWLEGKQFVTPSVQR
jgi:acetyl esterase/lipase